MHSVVYHTRDPQSAATLKDKAVTDATAPTVHPTAQRVPGLPAAKCFARSDWTPRPTSSFKETELQLLWRVKCFAAVDRYVLTSASEEEKDAKQQISAQYQFLRADRRRGLGADAGLWALC